MKFQKLNLTQPFDTIFSLRSKNTQGERLETIVLRNNALLIRSKASQALYKTILSMTGQGRTEENIHKLKMKKYRSYKQSAFTLIELMIALSLVLVLAHLVFTSSSFVNRFIVRTEAEKLVATCRYLRQRAMSTNTLQKIIFDLEHNSYRYEGDHEQITTKLSSRVQFGVGASSVLGPPSAPTAVITNPITYQNHEILFYPDGILSAGLIYLSDISGKYIYAVSSPVSSVSFLRTYVYDGTWKLLK